MHWHILTGEYPPMRGGLADYTFLLARALAEEGDDVDVWVSANGRSGPEKSGVRVHRLPGRFGWQALKLLNESLRSAQRPFRLLVQYVPFMYGWRGMNLALCTWLNGFRRAPLWVMFHEVAYPWGGGQPWRHNFLSAVQRVMAGLLVHRAQRVFVATPAWEVMLRPLLPQGRTTEWLPVPSNLPETANHAAVAAIRTAAIPNGGVLLGHFGTYGYSIASLLQGLLPPLLGSRPERRGILIGRNSHRFVEELCYRHPGLTGRVLATGGLAAQDLADHLAACDLLVQPYSEGVTTRRASLMGGLCLGVPVVTNRGVMTEPIWKKSGAVALVEDTTGPTFLHAVEELLASTSERKRLRLAGVHFYREWFALERTVAVLRGKPITPDGIS